MAAGSKGFLDFALYPTGSTTSFSPPGVAGGSPLMFDMQQYGLMEFQSFYPAWAMALAPHPPINLVDIACADLDDVIDVPGLISSETGPLQCCD